MNVKRLCLIVLVMLFTAVSLQTVFAGTESSSQAPIYGADALNAIPGEYLVILGSDLDADANADARASARENGGQILHVYEASLNGFAAKLTPDALAAMRQDPNVAYIETNKTYELPNLTTGHAANAFNQTLWAHDRINQRELPLDGNDAQMADGAGVHVYVIDSGINTTHVEFAGRIGNGINVHGSSTIVEDCYGHGTYIAGIIGGSSYGVAKGVTLHPVKIGDCTSQIDSSSLVAGIAWVELNHTFPAVANISIETNDNAVQDAAEGLIVAGVTVVASAGHGNNNACTVSPANVLDAITVAASDENDYPVGNTNSGPCVDVFAPGLNIESAWIAGTTATSVGSGTSPAAAHVSGVAALALQVGGVSTPWQVAQLISDSATRGAIGNIPCETLNLLVYSELVISTEPIPDLEKCAGCQCFYCKVSQITNPNVSENADGGVASVYLVRDKLFAGSAYGEHLTALYYEHSGRMVELVIGDDVLREGAVDLLHIFMPGIEAMFDERAEEVRLTPEMIAQTRQFLEDLAKADAGGALTETVIREMESIPWSALEGQTFTNAWGMLMELNS